MLWTHYLVNYFFYFISHFFRFFPYSFNWNKFLCLPIWLNFLCLYEISWSCYLFQSWSGVLVWEHPYLIYVCSKTDGRAGSDSIRSHIFPQGVLAAITLVGGGAGGGGAKARARCEQGLFLCSLTNTIGSISQVAGAEDLRVRSKLALFPVSVCSPPSQY